MLDLILLTSHWAVHCWWECKMMQLLWETIWWVLKKLKIELPYDPTIPLLGTYTKELKVGSQRDVCTPVFVAALFTIVKRLKQPKRPSTGEWITRCDTHMQWDAIQP
uniref:Uncharacterized protein n=1 Tax=Equus caballus TaxID=9796 RepID=A0A9L0S4Z6_HORSE